VTPRLRPYADRDWEGVLDLCLLAFAAGCGALEIAVGHELDWAACLEDHLRSLVRSSERRRLVVAEDSGMVVGFAHYEVDRAAKCGRLGVSAVHPARQGRGIGPLMYAYVLREMRAKGLKYATAETPGDAAHARARRAYEKVGFAALPMVQYVVELDRDGGPRRNGPGSARRTSAGAVRERGGRR
jgi:GNAT superfamily N-acetyltransferase